jgi:hypothetical protein
MKFKNVYKSILLVCVLLANCVDLQAEDFKFQIKNITRTPAEIKDNKGFITRFDSLDILYKIKRDGNWLKNESNNKIIFEAKKDNLGNGRRSWLDNEKKEEETGWIKELSEAKSTDEVWIKLVAHGQWKDAQAPDSEYKKNSLQTFWGELWKRTTNTKNERVGANDKVTKSSNEVYFIKDAKDHDGFIKIKDGATIEIVKTPYNLCAFKIGKWHSLQPLNTQLDAKLLKGKLKKNMMTVKQVKEKKEKSKKVAKGKKEW